MKYISSENYNYSFSEKKKEDNGKVGVVQRSDKKDKKFKVLTPEGKTVHFGHSDYTIKAGKNQEAADSYCARSAGIKDSGKWSPNQLSRRAWGCISDKSHPDKMLRIGDKV